MKLLIAFLFLVSGIAQGAQDLIGGTPVQPGEYPEVVYITNGSARCSATIIGPRVIMTAGHCVADGGVISEVVHNQLVFKATCKQAPLYRDHKEDHDMALCKTDKVLAVKYASISAKGPALGEVVTLSGYGCIKPGGGGGNDGIFRTGQAKVIQLPSATDDWFYTRDTAALCFGDSGGPVFLKLTSPTTQKHLVIGVNSRGNARDLSLLTALYIEKSHAFFKAFASEQGVEICGINKDCGDGSKPGKPEVVNPECEKYERWYKVYQEKAYKYKAKYDQCQKSSFFEDAE